MNRRMEHRPSTSRPAAFITLDRWHDAAYWGLLLAACAVMLVMNVLTPYKEDDMGFTLIDGVWTPVHTLGDLLQSCRNHYSGTNGRLADIVPAVFAGFLGKGAFNVCNALMFGLMAHLLSLLSTRRRSITVIALLMAVVGTCYPVPGETMLWMAGSANYLWAITLSLALVYCLQRHQGSPLGTGRAVLLFAGALVAGGFNEATSFGFFAGLCLYYAFNRRQFDRRAAVALTGYLAGLLLIVASPAAWDRAADGGIILNLPPAELLKTRWFIFHEKVWRFYLPLAALAVGLLALLTRRGRDVRRSMWTYIFLCLSLVMFALGLLHERAYAPWATVSLLIVAAAIDWALSRWPWARAGLIVVALALAAFTFTRGIHVLRDYQAYHHQVEQEIAASPAQAVLPEREFKTYSRFVKPVNYQSGNFFGHEVIYRAYYGKKNVQFVGDSVYVRYHEGRLLDGATVLPTTCDRPDVLGKAYLLPDQTYMAVELVGNDLPATFQTARYLDSAIDIMLPDQERQRRQQYGIKLDYVPVGFYPLQYQGKSYLISSRPGTFTQRMVFPLDISATPAEATLTILQ